MSFASSRGSYPTTRMRRLRASTFARALVRESDPVWHMWVK